MAFKVGEAEVDVRLNDRGLMSELTAAEAKVRRTMARIDAMRAEAEITADLDDLDRKMARAKALLEKWEHEKAEATLDVDAKKAEAQIRYFETRLKNLTDRKHEVHLELEARRDAQARLMQIQRGLQGINREAKKNEAPGLFQRMASELSRTAVRIGPFTLSLRALSITVGLLGPMLNAVIGGIAALAGGISTGLVGTLGLAAAGATGFGLSLIGIVGVTKPLIEQFKKIKQASDAYNSAVQRYGKSSDQAKLKQKQLNSVLEHVNPIARKAFIEMGNFSDRWSELTAPARQRGLTMMAEGIRTVGSLLPTFARETNQLFSQAEGGWQSWMRGLRSPEAQGIIKGLLSDFNRALPSLMRGFGSLGTAAGRVLREFSLYMPGMSAGFAGWARRIEEATGPAGRLAERVAKLVSDAKALGRFTSASGGLVRAVLGAGSASGIELLDRMTEAVQRWTVAVRGGALTDFFSRSTRMLGDMAQVLAPIARMFAEWTSVLSPLTTALLRIAAPVAQIAAAFLSLEPVKRVIQGVALAIAAGFAVGKIHAAALALMQLASAIRAVVLAAYAGGGLRGVAAMFAGKLGTALTGIGSGAAAGAGAAAGQAAGGAAKQQVTKQTISKVEMAAIGAGGAAAAEAATKFGRLMGVLRGVGTVARGTAAPIAVIAAAFEGLTTPIDDLLRPQGLPKLQASVRDSGSALDWLGQKIGVVDTPLDRANKRLQTSGTVAQRSAQAYRLTAASMGDLGSQYQYAREDLARANSALDKQKKGTDGYRIALAQQRDALRSNQFAQEQWEQAVTQSTLATQRQEQAASEALGAAEQIAAKQPNNAAAQERLTAATRQYEAAANRSAASALNMRRTFVGLPAVLGAAEQKLGALARIRPNLAQKIAVKFDLPKDVGAVSSAAKKALGAGASIKQVVKIVGDSSNAEQAIRRLQALELREKKQKISETGAPAVLSKLAQILGIDLPKKNQRVSESGAGNVVKKLGEILGITFGEKKAKVSQSGAEGVIGLLQRVAGLMVDRSSTNTITTVYKTIGRPGNAPGANGQARPTARGRQPGPQYTALVAEGRGPEWRVNPQTGEFEKLLTPQIRQISPDDYIIPTEPAYRQRGRELLGMVARDLGMPGFKKGKGGRPKPSLSKGERQQLAERAAQMPIPEAVKFGAVSEDESRKRLEDTRDRYQKRGARLQRLDDQIKDQQKRVNQAKGEKAKKRERAKLAELKGTYNQLRDGGNGTSSYRQLYLTYLKTKKRHEELVKVNRQIERMNTQQETARQQMENAAKTGNVAGYNAAKSRRTGLLEELRKIYARASELAKDPNFKAEIDSKLEGTIAEQLGLATGDNPFAPPTIDSLEDFLKANGRFAELQGLQKNVALAAANTPLDLSDDKQAQGALVGFYENVLGFAQQVGASDSIVTEAAQALSGARDTLNGFNNNQTGNADTDAELSQLQERLRVATAERDLANSYAAVAGGPGDIGMGGYRSARQAAAAGGPAQIINVNTLIPGDARMLDAVGAAASSAFSNQPRIGSAYFVSGY